MQWQAQLHRTPRESEGLSATTRRDRKWSRGTGIQASGPSLCSPALLPASLSSTHPQGARLQVTPHGFGLPEITVHCFSIDSGQEYPCGGVSVAQPVTQHIPCGHQGDSERAVLPSGTHPLPARAPSSMVASSPLCTLPHRTLGLGTVDHPSKCLHLQLNHTPLTVSEICRKWLRLLGPPTKAICVWEEQNRPCRC